MSFKKKNNNMTLLDVNTRTRTHTKWANEMQAEGQKE